MQATAAIVHGEGWGRRRKEGEEGRGGRGGRCHTTATALSTSITSTTSHRHECQRLTRYLPCRTTQLLRDDDGSVQK